MYNPDLDVESSIQTDGVPCLKVQSTIHAEARVHSVFGAKCTALHNPTELLSPATDAHLSHALTRTFKVHRNAGSVARGDALADRFVNLDNSCWQGEVARMDRPTLSTSICTFFGSTDNM